MTALRPVIAADPNYRLDAVTTSPRVMDAWIAARGAAPAQVLTPAPPTARPDSAHCPGALRSPSRSAPGG